MSDSNKPLILITNDDSVFANGIKYLMDVASEFGEVIVVAPDSQKSACSHGMTLAQPLRAKNFPFEKNIKGFAVNGTPVDCAKLAFNVLLDRKPDLVLSGINHGSNAGINAIYSGTVSGAVEGSIIGIPSIAASCTSFATDADMSGVVDALRKLIPIVLENGLPQGVTLNVNAPEGPLKGIKWAKQARSHYTEEFEPRVDPHGQPYYWVTGTLVNEDATADTDLKLLEDGWCTVTPLRFDITDYKALESLIDINL